MYSQFAKYLYEKIKKFLQKLVKYKNKTYLSNFVDNAIINKNHREKGIFKELMNYISNYSNEMNTKFIQMT